MKFSFDTADFEDRRNRRILGYIYNEFVIKGDFEDNLPKPNFAAASLSSEQMTEYFGCKVENTAPIVSEAVVQTDLVSEPAVAPAVVPDEEPKAKRGRKSKVNATAAELHQALKAVENDIEVARSETDVASTETIVAPTEADESFDLMDILATPSAPPNAVTSASELVDKVRAIMMERGHVWMRNVLEDHKKISKTIAELPEENLRAILANPDKYNEHV